MPLYMIAVSWMFTGDNIEDQCVGQPCGSDSLVQCKNVISNYTDTNNNPSSRTLGTTCHCPHGYEYNSHNKECIGKAAAV